MKREALRHPKTQDLASRLRCSRPTALGHLTLLWDWTAEFAIAGNVGRWPNGAIAGGCDWQGDADEFVTALIGAGWLDEDTEHRLVIHHWGQHCENWIRAKCQKLGITLLGGTAERQAPKSGTQEPLLSPALKSDLTAGLKSGSFSCDRTNPIQSEPNPASTNASWLAVEAELSDLGLGSASNTVKTALTRGYTPERVREIISFWKSHPEWGAGAIKVRIEETPASTPAESGCWPKATEKAARQIDSRISTYYGPRLEKIDRSELEGLVIRAGLTLSADQIDHCRGIPATRSKLIAQMALDDATANRAPPATPPPATPLPAKRERSTHANEPSVLQSSAQSL